jgi:hypothetical protein
MLNAVLHAMASSEYNEAPFLIVVIFPVWDDTPWSSFSTGGHRTMTTLIRIPTGHMRFVPALRQSDETTTDQYTAKWPVEFVLIFNEAGREAYQDQSRIRRGLAPSLQDITCRMTPAQVFFFPTARATTGQAKPRTVGLPPNPTGT